MHCIHQTSSIGHMCVRRCLSEHLPLLWERAGLRGFCISVLPLTLTLSQGRGDYFALICSIKT
ncbi:Uncharacterised protein [Serratia quinivorans]|nr:Uncharacterised protein [Serratia quinivorans]